MTFRFNNAMSDLSKSPWSFPRDNVSLLHDPKSNANWNTRKIHKETEKPNVISI